MKKEPVLIAAALHPIGFPGQQHCRRKKDTADSMEAKGVTADIDATERDSLTDSMA